MVHRYREGTPSQFWATYSEDGQHLSWKAINTKLAAERVDRDRKLVIQARREYGDVLFATTFQYRKGSVYRVMTKPSMIARKYRQLHRMEPDLGENAEYNLD